MGAAVDRARGREFDAGWAMSDHPPHIYASTARRRGRRWNRRRALWPFALGALAAAGSVVLVAGVLLNSL